MNETVKEWLKELYKGAIEEARGTIENERVWANGSPDAETAAMHEQNVELQEEYIAELTKRLAEIED